MICLFSNIHCTGHLLSHHPYFLHLSVCLQEGPVTFIADLAERRPVRLRGPESVELKLRVWLVRSEVEVSTSGDEAKMPKDADAGGTFVFIVELISTLAVFGNVYFHPYILGTE